MTNQKEIKSPCPYLGLANDRDSRFSYPESSHICFADNQRSPIALDHQSNFCLNQNHLTCSRYIDFDPDLVVSLPPKSEAPPKKDLTFVWIAAGVAACILVIAGAIYFGSQSGEQEQVSVTIKPTVATATPTSTPIPTSTEDPALTLETSVSGAFLATPTATHTPFPGSEIMVLSPEASDIGWVTSEQQRGNKFGDSYLYAGIFEGQIYNSAFQFDLSSIPRGAPIYRASLQLTGLDDERLNKNRDESNPAEVWSIKLLDEEIDKTWRRLDYQTLFNAPVLQSLSPILGIEDLGVGKINTFELTPDQIKIISKRVIDNEKPTVSFRVDGPLVGSDNLFAWDTGHGPNTQNNNVELILEVGEPPATPPAYNYVLVTSTSTPENVVTAAAIALQQTAQATRIGTATPIPSNVVTPTPFPDFLVIIPTATAQNTATAEAQAQISTAEAIIHGTPTPIPTNAITATPIPTDTPTPVPTPIVYVLITLTPTPNSIFAAATSSAAGTAQAKQVGTSTPLPSNWVTPFVITATPTPFNAATAQAKAELATAIAFTTGTPTPLPANAATATSTPVFEIIPLVYEDQTSPFPTAVPKPIPTVLVGKILFKSDRRPIAPTPTPGAENGSSAGQTESFKEHIFMYDLDTGDLAELTDSWPYYNALASDSWSSDGRFRVFTKNAIRYKNDVIGGVEVFGIRDDAPAIYVYDYQYGVEKQVTEFGKGIAYGGAWSPTSNEIVFTSNDSSDDEIWVANYDDNTLKQLTDSNVEFNGREIGKDTFVPELSKFASWSPDGSKIVFGSNRTGNFQIWVMNADGSDQQLLMGWDKWTPYNDFEPVWVKYVDPAPTK